MGHGRYHAVVGGLEVGIVGNLDGAKTLSNQADDVVVSYVGSVGRTVIPVGIGGACSQS